jgi:hypothetical protein
MGSLAGAGVGRGLSGPFQKPPGGRLGMSGARALQALGSRLATGTQCDTFWSAKYFRRV